MHPRAGRPLHRHPGVRRVWRPRGGAQPPLQGVRADRRARAPARAARGGHGRPAGDAGEPQQPNRERIRAAGAAHAAVALGPPPAGRDVRGLLRARTRAGVAGGAPQPAGVPLVLEGLRAGGAADRLPRRRGAPDRAAACAAGVPDDERAGGGSADRRAGERRRLPAPPCARGGHAARRADRAPARDGAVRARARQRNQLRVRHLRLARRGGVDPQDAGGAVERDRRLDRAARSAGGAADRREPAASTPTG